MYASLFYDEQKAAGPRKNRMALRYKLIRQFRILGALRPFLVYGIRPVLA
jgi:hypothetical protein